MTEKEAAEWIRTNTPLTVGNWLRAIDKACEALDYMRRMKELHDCNDCGWKDCMYRPKLGEPTRINCYQWKEM